MLARENKELGWIVGPLAGHGNRGTRVLCGLSEIWGKVVLETATPGWNDCEEGTSSGARVKRGREGGRKRGPPLENSTEGNGQKQRVRDVKLRTLKSNNEGEDSFNPGEMSSNSLHRVPPLFELDF